MEPSLLSKVVFGQTAVEYAECHPGAKPDFTSLADLTSRHPLAPSHRLSPKECERLWLRSFGSSEPPLEDIKRSTLETVRSYVEAGLAALPKTSTKGSHVVIQRLEDYATNLRHAQDKFIKQSLERLGWAVEGREHLLNNSARAGVAKHPHTLAALRARLEAGEISTEGELALAVYRTLADTVMSHPKAAVQQLVDEVDAEFASSVVLAAAEQTEAGQQEPGQDQEQQTEPAASAELGGGGDAIDGEEESEEDASKRKRRKSASARPRKRRR